MGKIKILVVVVTLVLLAVGCGGTPQTVSSESPSSVAPSSVSSIASSKVEPEPESELEKIDEESDESAPTQTSGLYRVRKSWDDDKSQIGAFADLENAKTLADERKSDGYKVFDPDGNVVYSSSDTLPVTSSSSTASSQPSSSQAPQNSVQIPQGMSKRQFELLKQKLLDTIAGLEVPEQDTSTRIAQTGELIYVGLHPLNYNRNEPWGLLIIRLIDNTPLTTFVYYDNYGERYEYETRSNTIGYAFRQLGDSHLPGLSPNIIRTAGGFVLGELVGDSKNYDYYYTQFYPYTVTVSFPPGSGYSADSLSYFNRQELFSYKPDWSTFFWKTYFNGVEYDGSIFTYQGNKTEKQQLDEIREKYTSLEFTTPLHYTNGEYKVNVNTKVALESVLSGINYYLG